MQNQNNSLLRKLDLNLLIVLKELLLTRHVSRAADNLNMSQPTVSRALQKLRRSFSDPLLIRAEQGYDLSPRAVEMLSQLDQLLSQLDSLLQSPEFIPSISKETINLSALDPEIISFIPQIFNNIRRLAPHMLLNIHSRPCNNFEQLAKGNVHFAITPLSPDFSTDQFHRIPLRGMTFVCLMNKNNALAKGELTLDRYLKGSHGLISVTGTGIGFVDERLNVLGKSRDIVLKLNTFSSVPDFCQHTDVVFLIPSLYAESLLSGRDLVVRKPPKELTLNLDTFYLYWHQRYHNDPMCIWLRRTIFKDISA